MSLRLLKVLVDNERRTSVLAILDEHAADGHWCSSIEDGRVSIEVVLPAEGNEPVLDALQKYLGSAEGTRMVLLPAQATVPRIREPEPTQEDGAPNDEVQNEERVPSRINREELYMEMAGTARTTRYYLVMVGLSAVVAGAGLLMDDTAVIIGAMVIAPLLGPNMALAFSTTLGDLELGKSAFGAAAAGAGVAFLISVLLGMVVSIDPRGAEIAARTEVGAGHIALALAAGAAGALSITRGMAAGLVGVMVAVALLPPLVAGGLLIGAGWWELGGGALLLVAANLACVNLAGIGVFLAQGVRPLSWWEGRGARRATVVASVLWTLLVVVLFVAIWLAPES